MGFVQACRRLIGEEAQMQADKCLGQPVGVAIGASCLQIGRMLP